MGQKLITEDIVVEIKQAIHEIMMDNTITKDAKDDKLDQIYD